MFNARRILSILLLASLLSTALLTSCGPPPPPKITSVTIAHGAKENNQDYEALGPTTSFETGTKEVHAIIKVTNPVQGTVLRSVWNKISASGLEEPISDKSYTFEKAYDVFAQDNYITAENPLQGKYKLLVYLDGQVANLTDFTVEKPATSFIEAVTTAQVLEDDAGNITPVDPTNTFPAGITDIHTLVRIAYPDNRSVAVITWYGINAKGERVKLAEQQFTPSDTDLATWTLDYTVTSTGGFDAAQYQIEIKLDGKLLQTLDLTVN
jgi:hypothetical protein